MSKNKTDLISMHRHIQAREFAEACRELESVKGMLRQRDMILWVLLNRHGQQKLTAEEMSATPQGAAVRCDSVPGEDAVTFSSVTPIVQENTNATEIREKPKDDQP